MGLPGSLYVDFGRVADNAADAIGSAIRDCTTALKGARIVTVQPDFVNLTELATLTGCTRQNMRRYASGEANAPRFPSPAVVSEPSLWHLASIGPWIEENTGLRFEDPGILEVAAVALYENQRIQYSSIATAPSRLGGFAGIYGRLIRDFGGEFDRLVSGRIFNPKKTAQAIARLAGSGTPKTKLNKLVFYADFQHFRDFGQSITGLRYSRAPLGPVPLNYEALYDGLKVAEIISIDQEQRGPYTASIIRNSTKSPDGNLTSDEIKTITSVMQKFNKTDAITIVEISHQEDAWIKTPPNGIISFSHADKLKA